MHGVETSEYERREILDYLQLQSPSDFTVEHVEKLASEHVMGQQYDVWDAHTSDGRWWAITPPTNRYSQDQIRSMDIALSFHVGLMTRMESRDSVAFQPSGRHAWVLEFLRRLATVRDNLDQAREVEDFQAVGMRLREALLTLIEKLRGLNLETPSTVTYPEQDGNFKGWAEVYAAPLASGSSSGRLRRLLKQESDCTWEYLGWLTHARNAGATDARLAYSATNNVIETFLFAAARIEREPRGRCPECSSYQLSHQHVGRDGWIEICDTCGWSVPTEAPRPIEERYRSPERPVDAEPDECLPLDDFSLYLTPSQARRDMEATAARIDENVEHQPAWSNPFAVRFDEYGSIHDTHRLVFRTFNHEPAVGADLTYTCAEPGCVNPKHAEETPLPVVSNWSPMLVERARVNDGGLIDLQVASATVGRRTISIGFECLDEFGLGDVSSLLERVVFVSDANEDGSISLIPAARRVSFTTGSTISGKCEDYTFD